MEIAQSLRFLTISEANPWFSAFAAAFSLILCCWQLQHLAHWLQISYRSRCGMPSLDSREETAFCSD